MNKRVLTALVALPILIFSILLPYFFPYFEYANSLFLVIAALGLSAGLFEFFSITKRMELKADAGIAYFGATALFVAFLLNAPQEMPDLLGLVIAGFMTILLITQTFRFQKDFSKMLIGTAVTLLGVFYIAFLGGFIVATSVGFSKNPVNYLSSKLLGFFFLVVMSADIGAYYIGHYFGKRKLVPKISPGKTWEGTFGGISLSCLSAAVASASFFPELPYKFSVPLAILMSIVGLLGDLVESAIKRGANMKDASTTLPGHGGFLDRLDSLLLNAPILYYFAKFYF